jgi:hypothetical protein
VVDATGGADFESISDAASSGITSGAIIEVQGLIDPITNAPVAYSNINVLVPTNASEIFPILLPHGISIMPVDSTPFKMPLGLRRCGIYLNDGDGIVWEPSAPFVKVWTISSLGQSTVLP